MSKLRYNVTRYDRRNALTGKERQDFVYDLVIKKEDSLILTLNTLVMPSSCVGDTLRKAYDLKKQEI